MDFLRWTIAIEWVALRQNKMVTFHCRGLDRNMIDVGGSPNDNNSLAPTGALIVIVCQ